MYWAKPGPHGTIPLGATPAAGRCEAPGVAPAVGNTGVETLAPCAAPAPVRVTDLLAPAGDPEDPVGVGVALAPAGEVPDAGVEPVWRFFFILVELCRWLWWLGIRAKAV
jgi:hypothetical protein